MADTEPVEEFEQPTLADVSDPQTRATATADTNTVVTNRSLVQDSSGTFAFANSIAPADPGATLKQVGTFYDNRVGESVNAAAAPKLVGPRQTPPLAETVVTGYKKSVPQQVTCCQVGGFLVSKYAAYDFILMRQAAAKSGIRLDIVSAFRDNDEQTRLYRERQDPRIGAVKGPAAKPGFSNHQLGIAIDINVGIKFQELKNGVKSFVYTWLKSNAALFGFDNDEVPTEPWHWRHLSDSMVAQPGSEDLLSAFSMTDAANAAAVNNSQLNALLNLNRNVADRTNAYSRSAQMASTSRQTHIDNRCESAVFSGTSISKYLAQYAQAQASVSTPPAPFEKGSLDPLVYNFSTGKWGDNKPV